RGRGHVDVDAVDVADGRHSGRVGADEVALDGDAGHTAEQDAITVVSRDGVAGSRCRPADGHLRRTVIDLDALRRVGDGGRAGGGGGGVVALYPRAGGLGARNLHAGEEGGARG